MIECIYNVLKFQVSKYNQSWDISRQRASRSGRAGSLVFHVIFGFCTHNSALTPKILIFRKKCTDEKSPIFWCKIDIWSEKNRPGPARLGSVRPGPGRFFFISYIDFTPKNETFFISTIFSKNQYFRSYHAIFRPHNTRMSLLRSAEAPSAPPLRFARNYRLSMIL